MLKTPTGRVELQASRPTTLASSASGNDSDKDFQVPNGKQWQVFAVWVEFIATATVGLRQLELSITDNLFNQWVVDAPAVQGQSTTHNYVFTPGGRLSIAGTSQTAPLPEPCSLRDFWRIRVRDKNAIDAAADDMRVHIIGADTDTGAALL
jgi:hypothetical protein